MTHTPLPWKLLKQTIPFHMSLCNIVDSKGIMVASTQYNPPAREDSESQMKPNAEFIVRACNTHNDLLDVCKAIFNWYKECNGTYPLYSGALITEDETLTVWKMLENVISKAEGH